MRDYLYIPLGGNRVSSSRLYINLSVVFLISGFWHGAAWTFVFWGAFHGAFLIFDRLFLLKVLKRIGKLPAIFITYIIVLIGWVFFRAENFAFAFDYTMQLFSFEGMSLSIFVKNRFWVMLILATLFSFFAFDKRVENWANNWFNSNHELGPILGKAILSLVLGTLCILEIYGSAFNPFIYFKF